MLLQVKEEATGFNTGTSLYLVGRCVICNVIAGKGRSYFFPIIYLVLRAVYGVGPSHTLIIVLVAAFCWGGASLANCIRILLLKHESLLVMAQSTWLHVVFSPVLLFFLLASPQSRTRNPRRSIPSRGALISASDVFQKVWAF
jgi:hypothetical protein